MRRTSVRLFIFGCKQPRNGRIIKAYDLHRKNPDEHQVRHQDP
jgi:hypothetical protein